MSVTTVYALAGESGKFVFCFFFFFDFFQMQHRQDETYLRTPLDLSSHTHLISCKQINTEALKKSFVEQTQKERFNFKWLQKNEHLCPIFLLDYRFIHFTRCYGHGFIFFCLFFLFLPFSSFLFSALTLRLLTRSMSSLGSAVSTICMLPRVASF